VADVVFATSTYNNAFLAVQTASRALECALDHLGEAAQRLVKAQIGLVEAEQMEQSKSVGR
jgi:hypothetical protein